MASLAGLLRRETPGSARSNARLVRELLAKTSRAVEAPTEVWSSDAAAIGVRGGDLDKRTGLAWAGFVHVEPTAAAADVVRAALGVRGAAASRSALRELDGEVAAAWASGQSELTLLTDPFGARALHVREHAGVTYFATELSSLLDLPSAPLPELDLIALHLYLSCSFIPGPRTAFRGIRALPPGSITRLRAGGRARSTSYVDLREEVDDRLDLAAGVERLVEAGRAATRRRLPARGAVGLYLSGGLDSSAVGAWLADAKADVHAFSLDFGRDSVELAEAKINARELGLRLTPVPALADDAHGVLDAVVDALEQPFGDPVTAPHYLLGRAARRAGLDVAFNGEGGDQLFGGWTTKPMIAAQAYATADRARLEQRHLAAYHRFYEQETRLYSRPLVDRIRAQAREERVLDPFGAHDPREDLLAPTLSAARAGTSFLSRLRLSDIQVKGRFNIMPRAERIGAAAGISVRAPLFDRALTELSFRMPRALKLAGAREKGVLRAALERRVPPEILDRRKSGMTVPALTWLGSAFFPVVRDLLSESSLAARGLFRAEYVRELLDGRDRREDPRVRRIGDKVWTLLMLEAFLRRFVDRGAPTRARVA